MEIGIRGVFHGARAGINDGDAAMAALGDGGDGGCALKAVVAQQIGRDIAVFIDALGVVGNVDDGIHGQTDDLGGGMSVIIGDRDGEAVCAVVVSDRGVGPCARGRIDAGGAVCRRGGDCEVGAVGQAVGGIGCAQGAGDGPAIFVATAGDVAANRCRVVYFGDRDSDGRRFRDAGGAGDCVGVAVGAMEIGIRGVFHGARAGINDGDAAMAALGDGGDGGCALKAVVAQQIGRDIAVFIDALGVVRNVCNRANRNRNRIRIGHNPIRRADRQVDGARSGIVVRCRCATDRSQGRIDLGRGAGNADRASAVARNAGATA